MLYKSRNEVSARYEILRGGGVWATMAEIGTPEIQCDTDTELVTSIRGTFYGVEGVNWFSDRLRAVAVVNGTEFPVGTFVVTTSERGADGGRETETLEGYSMLYLAQRKKIETRLSLAAGTGYIDTCVNLLATAGITNIEAEPSAYTLATAREDWDIGTPVLTIVNALLGEISYDRATVSLDGKVVLRKYTPPTIATVKHTYVEGENSVILPSYKRTDDRFDKANVFRVSCDNADMTEIMVAVAENNSPTSPYSTVNAGRILYTEKMDNVPSQAALLARANMLRDKSMQTEEVVEFYTAIAPDHEPGDTVALAVGGVSGIYAETGWRMGLSAAGTMTHTARRVIQ